MILGPEAAIEKFTQFASGGPMTELGNTIKGLGNEIDTLVRNILKLFNIETEGSSLLLALNGLVKTLQKIIAAIEGIVGGVNKLMASDNKPATARELVKKGASAFDLDQPEGEPKRIFGGLIGKMIDWFSPGQNPLGPSAEKLNGAADRLSNAADRLQAPPAPAAPGTVKQGAVAPTPAQPNPQQYGAK